MVPFHYRKVKQAGGFELLRQWIIVIIHPTGIITK